MAQGHSRSLFGGKNFSAPACEDAHRPAPARAGAFQAAPHPAATWSAAVVAVTGVGGEERARAGAPGQPAGLSVWGCNGGKVPASLLALGVPTEAWSPGFLIPCGREPRSLAPRSCVCR